MIIQVYSKLIPPKSKLWDSLLHCLSTSCGSIGPATSCAVTGTSSRIQGCPAVTCVCTPCTQHHGQRCPSPPHPSLLGRLPLSCLGNKHSQRRKLWRIGRLFSRRMYIFASRLSIKSNFMLQILKCFPLKQVERSPVDKRLKTSNPPGAQLGGRPEMGRPQADAQKKG